MMLQRFRRTPSSQPIPVQAHPHEKAFAGAVAELTSGRIPDLDGLPEGPFRDALHGLVEALPERRMGDLAGLAQLSLQASEAAINVGWTTHDVGQIAHSSQTIASATEELVASIAQVAETSANAGMSAQDAQDSMRACLDDVGEARGAMQAIHARTVQIDERLSILQSAVARIGTMASTIAAISSQTNLLALNATIEAARAGDAGRGFAVVASEVKALSAQTAKSTEEIRTWIGTLQAEMASIAEAVSASRASVEEGNTVVARLAQRVDVADEGIRTTSSLNTALAETLVQQRSATEEIASNVQAIAGKAAKTHEEIEQINGRLLRAETKAIAGLGDASGMPPSFGLVRLPALGGAWKRRIASILLGATPAAGADATLLPGGTERLSRSLLEGTDLATAPGFAGFREAEQAAHEQAARTVAAVAKGDWAAGTPAYGAMSEAIDRMLSSASELLKASGASLPSAEPIAHA